MVGRAVLTETLPDVRLDSRTIGHQECDRAISRKAVASDRRPEAVRKGASRGLRC